MLMATRGEALAAGDRRALDRGAALGERQRLVVAQGGPGGEERGRDFGNVLGEPPHVAGQIARMFQAFGEHAAHQRLAVIEGEADDVEAQRERSAGV